MSEVDEAGFESVGGLVDVDAGEGSGELEAAGAGGAWIKEEDSVAMGNAGLVGMTADHSIDSGGFGLDGQVVDGVDEEEELTAEVDGFGHREFGAGSMCVDVAADGGDGGDLAEAVEDLGIANVAGVEEMVTAGKGGEDFGTEQTVSVGENADAHGLRVSCGTGNNAR